MSMKNLLENQKLVSLAQPVNAATAGIAPKFASIRNYPYGSLLVAVGTAADSPVLQLRQAKNVAGSGIKALTTVVKGYKVVPGTSPQEEEDLAQEFTISNGTITLDANTSYVIDFRGAQLDVDNDFDCIGIEVDDPGSGTNDVAIQLLLRNGPCGIAGSTKHIPSARVNQSNNPDA